MIPGITIKIGWQILTTVDNGLDYKGQNRHSEKRLAIH
jgi:hypothetical protein